MTRAERVIIAVLVTSMVGWAGAVAAEREGSGSHHHEGSGSHHDAAIFREGDTVELMGRITGTWLTVTEGPHAGQRFALVENRVLEELKETGPATATYRLSGTALEEHGTNRLAITSFQRALDSEPAASPREGTGTSSQPSYREGS